MTVELDDVTAIRWDKLPHGEIRLKIYERLRKNDLGRSERDALRHILRRRLSLGHVEDHRRFAELQARDAVEHLRYTRDCYREYLADKNCQPALEAHWVVLRFAVFPTAIMLLRGQVREYARLSQVRAVDLSILFGVRTRPCFKDIGHGMTLVRAPDPDDKTIANEGELESLSNLINDDSLLTFRDIRDGGGIWLPGGGGPFSTDDAMAVHRSFGLCGLKLGFTLPKWLTLREKLWQARQPWSDGLCNLFAAVQEELISQWSNLPIESLADESAKTSELLSSAGNAGKLGLRPVTVPPPPILPLNLERGRDCEQLANEMGTIRHKYLRSGMTLNEIQKELPVLDIWKRVEQLSPEDQDTFRHPGMWEPGYDNLLLGKIYPTSRGPRNGGTINNWRKDYRAYQRWQTRNPNEAPEKFIAELEQRKRNYRKSTSESNF